MRGAAPPMRACSAKRSSAAAREALRAGAANRSSPRVDAVRGQQRKRDSVMSNRNGYAMLWRRARKPTIPRATRCFMAYAMRDRGAYMANQENARPSNARARNCYAIANTEACLVA